VYPRATHVAVLISILALTSVYARAGAPPGQAREPRPANSYAIAVGTPLNTIVVFGDQYNGGDELYDVKITVAEVVRGEKARQMVKEASATNSPPATGMEYLLARVKFEFAARVRPEHYSYTLDPSQFSAMSAATAPYAPANLAVPVKPELRAILHSGDSVEGWVAFHVPRSDHTPLMMFREDVGSVIHQGDASFFKLYRENSSANTKAKPS
jgi:hypothetical protein